MGKKMKLYVWKNVLTDYTSGIMFAVAPSADGARKELLKQCNYLPQEDLNKEPVEVDLKVPSAFYTWGGS